MVPVDGARRYYNGITSDTKKSFKMRYHDQHLVVIHGHDTLHMIEFIEGDHFLEGADPPDTSNLIRIANEVPLVILSNWYTCDWVVFRARKACIQAGLQQFNNDICSVVLTGKFEY